MKERIFIPLNYNDIQKCLNKTNQLIQSFHQESFISCSKSLESLSEDGIFFISVEKLNKSAILYFKELHQLALGIELYINHYISLYDLQFTQEQKQHFHEYKTKYRNKFLTEFRSFVQVNGEIDFFKHPVLRALYTEKIELEQKIRRTLYKTF